MVSLNHWLELSIAYANQRSYLDDLFQVYPTIPEGIREIDQSLWNDIEIAFQKRHNIDLIKNMLKLKLFPIKDSYVAYLKRDPSAIERNPNTVDRLCGRLYEMGLDEIYKQSSNPKETNRQIGPLFKRWLRKGTLGIQPVPFDVFIGSKGNAILDASDAEMMSFAREALNYKRDKGLDFIARFNGQYVIGEAKFLTDFGGHQNAQLEDAITTLKSRNVRAVIIAILDGVLYIKGKNKMYRSITTKYGQKNIMSSLVLREFLYQL